MKYTNIPLFILCFLFRLSEKKNTGENPLENVFLIKRSNLSFVSSNMSSYLLT